MSQPAADLAVTLGDLAADITVEAALNMADEELRGRLQEELERKSRQALIEAADAMEAAASTPHSDTPCSSRFIPPSYRVTVQNTGDEPLTGISVTVGDSEGIYWGAGATVDLDPGEVFLS